MYILVNAYENRSVETTQKTIGKTFENEATILKILLHGDMVENDVYLEFKKEDCSKFMTQPLQIVNDEDNNYYVEYKMPNSLLDQIGNLRMEIVLRKDDYVWKSYAIDFDVLDSINASNEVAQENNDFISYVMDRVNVIEKDGEGYIILCIPHVVQWYEANGKPSKVVVSGGGNFNLIYDGQTSKGSYTVVPVNIDTSDSIATQISQGYLRIKPNWTTGGSSSWKRYLISGYTTKNIILTVN